MKVNEAIHAYIVLVSGTPGTGKTVIGTMLSGEVGCRFVDSSKLFIERGVVRPDPTGRYTLVIDYAKALKIVRSILNDESCYIVETHYPLLWLDAAETDIPFIILLRAHPLIIYNRLMEKGWPRPKVLENAVAEATNVVADDLHEWSHMTLEVDTSDRRPDTVVEKVFELLYGWRTGIYIDWLSVDEGLVSIVSKWLVELDRHKYGLRE